MEKQHYRHESRLLIVAVVCAALLVFGHVILAKSFAQLAWTEYTAAAIPFVMLGFWILNVLSSDIGNYPNPALFTATAMIGMIALAGIVVRNSLVLIEFVQQSLAEGRSLHDALIESGVVRMRPILLTAGTTLLGNVVITLDPIFNGLAWAIIFGITASTIFTLLVVPVVYNLAYQNTKGHGLPQMEEEQ